MPYTAVVSVNGEVVERAMWMVGEREARSVFGALVASVRGTGIVTGALFDGEELVDVDVEQALVEELAAWGDSDGYPAPEGFYGPRYALAQGEEYPF